MTTVKRDALQRVLALARPALANQPYIPALTHFCFADGGVTAYNDIAAIYVQMPHDLSLCLPGDLLLRTLATLPAGGELLLRAAKDSAVQLTSGRTNLKVPMLPRLDFPLDWARDLGPAEATIELDNEMLVGIKRCLLAVGSNPHFPEQMGVTLDSVGGKATLFSTDDSTISQYTTSSALKLPADAPAFLPTFFCEQAVALADAFPDDAVDLSLHAGALVLTVVGNKARLMQKVDMKITTPDFSAQVVKHTRGSPAAADIPVGWEAALQRALLVQGASTTKATKVEAGDGGVVLTSMSQMGQADDFLGWAGKAPPDAVWLDPGLVVRGSKFTNRMAFGGQALLLRSADGKFTHLIAYGKPS